MTPKTFVGLRVGESGLKAIDDMAAGMGRTRSEAMRLLLAVGFQQWNGMPADRRKVLLAAHRLIDKETED